MTTLIEVNSDLFNYKKTHTLGHCISLDCAMGMGIAKQFVEFFPKMKQELKECVETNNLTHPFVILYFGENEETVFNLITKERYFHKPTYKTLERTLRMMRSMAYEHKITHIAIPKVGCGLDKLEWCRVKDLITDVFKDSSIEEIVVCSK